MPKTVLLFDVDGVLLNGKSFATKLEPEYGISYEMLQPFFKGPFLKATVGEHDLLEILKPYLAEWKWPHSEQQFLDYWFKAEHEVDKKLVNYVSEFRANGGLCYLATNQEKYRAQYILEEIGFKDSFDGMFASAHLGVKKPNIEFFEEMYDRLSKIPKDALLFWDDLPENVAACRKFGIDAELYTTYDNFKETMKNYA